jgi:hypothetical protein
MWRNGRRNGLKIRWAVKGPCRFESGHRQFEERGPLNGQIVTSKANLEKPSKLNAVLE